MEKLRIAMAKEVEKSSRTKGVRKAVRNVLDIHELLTLCAQAVATNDRRRAHELLKQIKQHASETGDATQRLGQCFAKGLEARLVCTGSQLSQLLMEDRLSIADFLHNIRRMRPHVFIQSILNCSYGSSYLSRFREVLFYCRAIFDMFDATMPRESKSRVVLEQGLFGRYALNAIACEGADLVERPEKYRQWQARNQRAGLRKLPLEPTIVRY